MKTVKLGVVGYTNTDHLSTLDDHANTSSLVMSLHGMTKRIQNKYGVDVKFEMVAGLTNTGINKTVYEYANHSTNPHVVKTIGIGSKEDQNNSNCDEKIICDDVVEKFADFVDCLVWVGNGDERAKAIFDRFTEKYPDKDSLHFNAIFQ